MYAADASMQEYDKASRMPLLSDIYKIYASRCFRANAMDFDDLLMNTNILFRDFPDVLASYQDRFNYILVDEYQDTNYAQYLIVKKACCQYIIISVWSVMMPRASILSGVQGLRIYLNSEMIILIISSSSLNRITGQPRQL